MEWLNGKRIRITPPARPKKITGTRLGAIMGKNIWKSPFNVWCEITRTYEEPFEDTIYTIAGKVIEPKQAAYMRKAYFMTELQSPTDLYGEDYFKKTRGDFFPNEPIFGGMWDYLLYEDGKLNAVLEMKTTKRAEDWLNGIPEHYALQAALYAYLLKVDQVYMVVSFLEEGDYQHPEDFRPSAANTKVIPFKLSEYYPTFDKRLAGIKHWWQKHVESGISPEYYEERDAEILEALRTNTLNPETDITVVLTEAETLQGEIEEVTTTVAEKEKRLKTLKNIIKDYAVKQFRDSDKSVVLPGKQFVWTVQRSEKRDIDKAALEADGLLEKYNTKTTLTYRLTNKPIDKEAE